MYVRCNDETISMQARVTRIFEQSRHLLQMLHMRRASPITGAETLALCSDVLRCLLSAAFLDFRQSVALTIFACVDCAWHVPIVSAMLPHKQQALIRMWRPKNVTHNQRIGMAGLPQRDPNGCLRWTLWQSWTASPLGNSTYLHPP